MPDWRLDQLISGLAGAGSAGASGSPELVGGGGATPIRALSEDSRTVAPGTLFVARRGRRVDGRGFAGAALDAGAAGVLTDDAALARQVSGRAPAVVVGDVSRALPHLAERFYGHPGRRLRLVGITGTNGKTTIAHGVRTLLERAGIACGLIGTISIEDGGPARAADLTTPMPIDLSRTLAAMVGRGCTAAAVEVSSHALAQGRTAGLEFDAGVFTNLTRDHLDEHGTMERYAACKARLFQSLGAGAAAITNADSEWSGRVVEACAARPLRCVSAGGAGDADARVRVLGAGLEGSLLRLTGPWGAITVRTRLIGAHNAMNLLQAVVAAHALGADPGSIAIGLERIASPAGRLEPVSLGPSGSAGRLGAAAGPRVLVDFAHTDDALAHTLGALRPLVGGGRLWCVYGCGGDRDRSKRPAMGRAAAGGADVAVLTSDNPRGEDPERIAADVLAGLDGAMRARTRVELDREAAIAGAIRDAEPGDVVLIAGKGHETEQILPDGAGGTVRRHFDDREVARAALGRRGRIEVHVDASTEAMRS